MFLHGGLMHLAGNMIFLWLVGCMLEMAWGRILYLGLYVAGGFFAAALFGLVHHAGTVAPCFNGLHQPFGGVQFGVPREDDDVHGKLKRCKSR